MTHLDVDIINTARDALRAAMKARGHRPERKATETFGQGEDVVNLWCPVCGQSGAAVATAATETVTLSGAAIKRCGEADIRDALAQAEKSTE